MVNDKVMTVVVFEREVLRLIFAYALQNGRSCKKNSFMMS